MKPDHVAARTIDLKNSIAASTTEDVKFQIELTFFIRQERGAYQPVTSQLLCTQKNEALLSSRRRIIRTAKVLQPNGNDE